MNIWIVLAPVLSISGMAIRNTCAHPPGPDHRCWTSLIISEDINRNLALVQRNWPNWPFDSPYSRRIFGLPAGRFQIE